MLSEQNKTKHTELEWIFKRISSGYLIEFQVDILKRISSRYFKRILSGYLKRISNGHLTNNIKVDIYRKLFKGILKNYKTNIKELYNERLRILRYILQDYKVAI